MAKICEGFGGEQGGRHKYRLSDGKWNSIYLLTVSQTYLNASCLSPEL